MTNAASPDKVPLVVNGCLCRDMDTGVIRRTRPEASGDTWRL